MVTSSRFPPTFEGNPFSYGFALFGLTLITAVSMAVLANYFLEARARKDISAQLGNLVEQEELDGTSPLAVHRRIVSGLLMTIVFGAFPDVLVLLAWGEANDRTMDFLFALDRLGDATALIPFMFAIVVAAAAQQAINHRLALEVGKIKLCFTRDRLKERMKMVVVVFLIAVGVTFAKSFM